MVQYFSTRDRHPIDISSTVYRHSIDTIGQILKHYMKFKKKKKSSQTDLRVQNYQSFKFTAPKNHIKS